MTRRRVESLAARHPWRLDLPVLLVVSFVLLVQGLTMPAMEIRAFLFWRDQYSIVTNIQTLYEDKQRTSAMVLAACSVGYPAIKIATLFFLWVVPFPAGWRSGFVRALRLLGRWSMLDVFTITAIVVSSRAIGPLQAKPLPGVYVYAASIFVLMIVTVLMDRLARHGR